MARGKRKKVQNEGEPKSKYKSKKALLMDSGVILLPEHIEKLKENGVILEEGTQFDSIKEAEYYRDILLPKVQSGEIDVTIQPKYTLIDPFFKLGKKIQAATYTPDFGITDRFTGIYYVVDVKGFANDRFPLKKKLFDSRYPDIELIIMKHVVKFGGWITEDEYAISKKKENLQKREQAVTKLKSMNKIR